MTYAQIRQLLEGLADRFEWKKVMEGDNIIGLTFVSSATPWQRFISACSGINHSAVIRVWLEFLHLRESEP